MSVLFIDSSYDIAIGLLDQDLRWLAHRNFKGQRASSTLQTETHRILKDHGREMKDLSAVVTVAGPGFYTGLRLSEGFSDVTSFFQIPHFAFYSHEVPSALGVKSGLWTTKAYRGEYFLHRWSPAESSTTLIGTSELQEQDWSGDVFIHSDTSLDEKLKPLIPGAISTSVLLKNEPEKIFKWIFDQKLRKESYYFRAPEDEFRMNP